MYQVRHSVIINVFCAVHSLAFSLDLERECCTLDGHILVCLALVSAAVD